MAPPTPEELDGIKAIARLLPESQTRNHIFLLLAHIDTQAAQIEALTEDIEVMKLGEKAADGLILQGRKYAEQIEALKEKLVEERAKQFDVDEPCIGRTHFEFCELMDGSCDGYPHMWEACPRKKEKLEEARQQLKAEIPEVGWE